MGDIVVVQSFSQFNSLWHQGLQQARLPCHSLPPRVCSNSYRLNWWCHPTILSSISPFSSCVQSCPASGSFPMNRLFIPGGHNIGASASASVLPMNIQDRFPLRLTDFDLFAVQGTLMSLLQHHSWKASVLQCSALFMVQISHPHTTAGKTITLTRQTFVSNVMPLLFNMLSDLS